MEETAGNPAFGDADVARAVVVASRDAIVAFDLEGRIITVNPAAEVLFGCQAGDVTGRSVEQLIFGDRRDPARTTTRPESIWERLAATSKTHECIGQAGDGSALDLELTVSKGGVNGRSFYVAVIRDVAARKRQEAQTRYLAHFDSLTGLPNRVLFQERLSQALYLSKRSENVLALMMLDLDRFKQVNDSLGHQVGDRLLSAVANRLRDTVRESDTVTRLGGDEFAVLVTNLHDADGAGTVAEAIVSAVRQPFDIDGERLMMTTSVGITTFPDDGENAETLLRNADRALYRAKAKGRDTYQFYVPEMDALVQAHKALERDLRQALEAGDLSLEYQPMVNADSGEIVGVEALIRWRDRIRGTLAAQEFIPIVERSDLILRLGKWVLRQVCTQARAWQEAGVPIRRLSINLSPAELHHRDLVAEIEAVLGETGVDPHVLQLEFSEDAFLTAIRKNAAAIARLRQMGVTISLDDFGSGISSLEILRRHPVDHVKIDRAFLETLGGGGAGAVLLGPLVELAHGLGAAVSIECVETREHLEQARARGVEELQGHFLSEPVNAAKFAEMARSGKPLRGRRFRRH